MLSKKKYLETIHELLDSAYRDESIEEKELIDLYNSIRSKSSKQKYPRKDTSFEIHFCGSCEGLTVICPVCGNNVCSGHIECEYCEYAYKIQQLLSKDKKLTLLAEVLVLANSNKLPSEFKLEKFRQFNPIDKLDPVIDGECIKERKRIFKILENEVKLEKRKIRREFNSVG